MFHCSSAKDATFYIGRRQEQKDTFSFALIHPRWYITASDKVGSSWKTVAAWDNKTQEFALDSSFVVVPYTMDDPLKNCDTIGPQEPEGPEGPPEKPGVPEKPGIPGQPPAIPGQPPPPSPGQPSYPSGPPGSNNSKFDELYA